MKQLLIIGCFYPFMLFSQTTLPLEERGCGLTEENMKPVCRQVITNICELKKAGKMTFLPPLANAERNDAGRTSGNSMMTRPEKSCLFKGVNPAISCLR